MGRKKRRVALVLAALMIVVSLAACAGNNRSSEAGNNSPGETNGEGTTEAPVEKEPVTLRILWPQPYGSPGIQKTEVAEEIRKKTGITMDIISGDPEKIKVMLASGDLADIMIVDANAGYAKNMIEGKQVLPLDDLLQNHGQDILNNMKGSLDAFKEAFGTDKYYFMPHWVNPKENPNVSYNPLVSYFLRWDQYKEMGNPVISTPDDLIAYLKQVQDKYPQTPDGKKTYGISGWTDWGLWPIYIPIMYESGWTEFAGLIDGDGKPHNRYAPDSAFWQGLEFWYKANNAGIVDPDSFTQKYDAFDAKAKAGQLLSVVAAWQVGTSNPGIAPQNPNAAFVPIPKGFSYNSAITIDGTADGDKGKSQSIAINSKHPDRAMELLNFLRTEEGGRLIWSGVKGVHWDDVNGSPELLDEYTEKLKADPNLGLATGIRGYDKLSGWGPNVISSLDNAPMDLTNTPKGLSSQATPGELDFAQTYGGVYPGDAINKLGEAGKMKTVPYTLKIATMPPEPDDLKKIAAAVEQYLIKNHTKAIFAKSDEEFKSVVADLQADIAKLGYDKHTAWYLEQWQIAYDKKNK